MEDINKINEWREIDRGLKNLGLKMVNPLELSTLLMVQIFSFLDTDQQSKVYEASLDYDLRKIIKVLDSFDNKDIDTLTESLINATEWHTKEVNEYLEQLDTLIKELDDKPQFVDIQNQLKQILSNQFINNPKDLAKEVIKEVFQPTKEVRNLSKKEQFEEEVAREKERFKLELLRKHKQ